MRLVPSLLALALVLPAAARPEAPPPYVLLQPGERPPALAVRTLDGETPSWQDLKGQAVVLDFWATWCAPCIKAIPALNALVTEFEGQPVRFLSVTYEKEDKVRPFLARNAMKTSVGLDDGCATFRAFKAWGIPMVVLVGKDGIVRGVIHPKDLTGAVVRDVIAGRTPPVEQEGPWPDPKGAEEYFCGAKS